MILKKLRAKKNHQNPFAVINHQLKAIEVVDQLIKAPELKKAFHLLSDQVNCIPKHFDELYMSTLKNLLQLTQTMSVSESNTKLLFLQQLHYAITGLTLTRGKLFPRTVSVEERNAHEPRWNYAIFCVSLLQDLLQHLNERAIEYFDQEQKTMGVWSPFYSHAAKYYQLHWGLPNNTMNSAAMMIALVLQIIPIQAMQWLAEEKVLFTQWWDTLLNLASDNELAELVRIAFPVKTVEVMPSVNAHKILNNDSQNKENFELSSSSNVTIVKDFLHWANLTITQQPEVIDKNFYRVTEGLLVTREALREFMSVNDVSEELIIESLKAANQLVLANNNPLHTYTTNDFTHRELIDGFLLQSSCLDKNILELPVTTLIQPDVM